MGTSFRQSRENMLCKLGKKVVEDFKRFIWYNFNQDGNRLNIKEQMNLETITSRTKSRYLLFNQTFFKL